jgi:hypothetical protein
MTAWTKMIVGTTSQSATVRMGTVFSGNAGTTVSIESTVTINSTVIQMNLFPAEALSMLYVAREAVLSLLDTRDFLGYQLAHAKGGVDDEEFRAIAARFLRRTKPADQITINEKVRTLVQLVGDRADTDTVSTIFNCEIEEAEAALTAAALQIEHKQIPLLFPVPNDDARSGT